MKWGYHCEPVDQRAAVTRRRRWTLDANSHMLDDTLPRRIEPRGGNGCQIIRIDEIVIVDQAQLHRRGQPVLYIQEASGAQSRTEPSSEAMLDDRAVLRPAAPGRPTFLTGCMTSARAAGHTPYPTSIGRSGRVARDRGE